MRRMDDNFANEHGFRVPVLEIDYDDVPRNRQFSIREATTCLLHEEIASAVEADHDELLYINGFGYHACEEAFIDLVTPVMSELWYSWQNLNFTSVGFRPNDEEDEDEDGCVNSERYAMGRTALDFDQEDFARVRAKAKAWMVNGEAPAWFVKLSEEAICFSRAKGSLRDATENGIEGLRLPMVDLPGGKCRAYLSLFGEMPDEWTITREQAAVYCALQSLLESQPRGPMPPRHVVQGIVQGWRVSYLGFCWEESNTFLDGRAPPPPHYMLLPTPPRCTPEQLDAFRDVRARYVRTVDELLAQLCVLGRRREPGSVRAYVAFALDLGASPNARHRDSHTSALGMLAERDDGDAIEELINAGAEIDAADSKGMTALMIAAACDSPRATLALLEGGASPFLRSRAGKTVEEFAASRPRVGGILRSWMAELSQQSISNQDKLLQEMESEEALQRQRREKKKNKKKKRKEKKKGNADGEDAEGAASGQGAVVSADRDEAAGAPGEGASSSHAKDRPSSGANSDRGVHAGSETSSRAGVLASGTAATSPSVVDLDAGAESDAASSDSEEVAETTVGVLGGRFGALGLAPAEPREEPDPSEPGPSRPPPDPPVDDSESWERAPAARSRNERVAAGRAAHPERGQRTDARLAAPAGSQPGPSHRGPASPTRVAGRDRASAAALTAPSADASAAGPPRPPASHPSSSADAGERPRYPKPASFFRGPSSGGGPPGAVVGEVQARPSRAAGGASPPDLSPSVTQPTSTAWVRAGEGARVATRGATEGTNPVRSSVGAEPARAPAAGVAGSSVPPPAPPGTASSSSPLPASAAASSPVYPAFPAAPASSPAARPSGVATPVSSPPGFPPLPTPDERPVHEILFPFPVAPPPPLQTTAPVSPPLRAPLIAPHLRLQPAPAQQAQAPPVAPHLRPQPPHAISAPVQPEQAMQSPVQPVLVQPTPAPPHAPSLHALPSDRPVASAGDAAAASFQPDAPADGTRRDAPPPAVRPESASGSEAPGPAAPGPAARASSAIQSARDRGMIQTLRSLLNVERGRRTRAEAETAAARAEIASLRAALEESRSETRAAVMAVDTTRKMAREALHNERTVRMVVNRKLEAYIQGLQASLDAEPDANRAEMKRWFLDDVHAIYVGLHADSSVDVDTGSGAGAATATASEALEPATSSASGVGGLEARTGPSAVSSSDRELPIPPVSDAATEAAERAGSGAFAASSTVVGAATDLSGSRAAIAAAASRLASVTSPGVLFDAGGFGVVGGGGQTFDAGGFGVVGPGNLWRGIGAARPLIPSWEALWSERRPEGEAIPQGSPLGAAERLPLNLDPTP